MGGCQLYPKSHIPWMMVTETGTLRGVSPGLCRSQVYVVSAAGQCKMCSTRHWWPDVLSKEAEGEVRQETVTGPGAHLHPRKPRDALPVFLAISEADAAAGKS